MKTLSSVAVKSANKVSLDSVYHKSFYKINQRTIRTIDYELSWNTLILPLLPSIFLSKKIRVWPINVCPDLDFNVCSLIS